MKYIQKDAICSHVKFLVDNLPKDRQFKNAKGEIFRSTATANNVALRNLKYWFKKFSAKKTTKTNSGQPSPYKEFDEEIHRMSSSLNLDDKASQKLLKTLSSSVIRKRIAKFKSSGSYLRRLIIRLKELRRNEEEARLRNLWFDDIPQQNVIYPEEESVIEDVNQGEECRDYSTFFFQGNQENEENKEMDNNFGEGFVNPIVEPNNTGESGREAYPEKQSVFREDINQGQEFCDYGIFFFQGNQEQEENKEMDDNFGEVFVNPFVESNNTRESGQENNENLIFFQREQENSGEKLWCDYQEESGRHGIFEDEGFGERDEFFNLSLNLESD